VSVLKDIRERFEESLADEDLSPSEVEDFIFAINAVFDINEVKAILEEFATKDKE
jgi:hypothetical protein